MAVVFLFRVAVALGASTKVWQSTQRTQSGQPSYAEAVQWLLKQGGIDWSDADQAEALSEHSGYAWQVANYDAPFELRKLHVIWSQEDLAIATDDSRVCTFHLAKIEGGVPVDTWDADDFTLINSSVNTWWGAIKDRFAAQTKLDRIKVYKSGPAIVPPQVPVYDADFNVAGTAAQSSLPPQVAITVTEKAGSKRHWGRFYLPSPGFAAGTTYARLDSTVAGDIADATDAWYEALRAGGLRPVVYRAPLPERTQKNGVVLPARLGSAWDVESIQVDDVFDVIRSRRWKTVALRTQRDVA